MEVVLFSRSLPIIYVLNWLASTSEVATTDLLHVPHCSSILCIPVEGKYRFEMPLLSKGAEGKPQAGLQLSNQMLHVLGEWRNAKVLCVQTCKFCWTILVV